MPEKPRAEIVEPRYPFEPEWHGSPAETLSEHMEDQGISRADLCNAAGLTAAEADGLFDYAEENARDAG